MSNNGAVFADLMGNVLLAEPLTERGRKAISVLRDFGFSDTLSENEFLEEIYIEPFTMFENLIPEADNFHVDSDTDSEVILKYAQSVELNTLMVEKSQFENSLKRLTHSLFVIKGVAGSGKTTYIHHLKKETDDIEFLVCNFAETTQTINLLGQRFDFKKKYQSNVWKFVSTILDLISCILQKDSESNYYTGEYTGFIKSIIKIYKSEIDRIDKKPCRPDDIYFVDMFEILELYTNEAPCDNSYLELGKNFHAHFQGCYAAFEKEEDKGKQEAIKLTTGFLIRLFYCLSKINNKKYVCVIDNIEGFMSLDETHPIQDCELQDIFDGVEAAIKNIRPRLPINIPGYQTFYGFVLLTREITANIAQYSQFEDYDTESEIDISEWFCAKDIFEKKKAYFRTKLPLDIDSPYLTAYGHIMNDNSSSQWSMHRFITKMYDNNHRRIVSNLVSAISVISEAEIKNFNTEWEKTLEGDKDYSSLKHLCRQFILKTLIDSVQKTHYFNKIMPDDESFSYTRRVVTLLNNVALNLRHKGDTYYYVSFARLIKTLLVPRNYPSRNPSEKQLNDLASVLYWMNATRNLQTNWAALITIKFDSNLAYSKENLYAVMKSDWNSYYTGLFDKEKPQVDIDVSSCGVQITTAGSFFAKITPEFEFFSCRFLFSEQALMSLENLKPINIAGKNTFKGIEIIKAIREKAFRHIDEVIESDKDYYSLPGTFSALDPYKSMHDRREIYSWMYKESPVERAITHPLRILHQHMGYIYHYIEYIKNDLGMHHFYNSDDSVKITTLAKYELLKYWEKLEAITKENPQYFNNYKPEKKIWEL